MIHPSAIVSPGARLAEGVSIGPWCQIGDAVELGEGTTVGAHVVMRGPTRIGKRNRIYPFSSIGEDPQDRKYAGERSYLEIGDDNVIREYCTFNRGTRQGGGCTRVGDRNWIMAYVHVAHDCQVGSRVVMANGATLAGHVVVEDDVTFGAFTMVHQFCRLGAHCFSAMGTFIGKDVPPFVIVAGNPAAPRGLNREGLRRAGFSAERIEMLRRAYRTLYRSGLTLDRACEVLAEMGQQSADVAALLSFLRVPGRGIVR